MEVISTCGALVLGYLIFKIIKYGFNFYRLYFTESKLRYEEFGKWAVVTGCTSGIGLEFSRQLAQKGMNIVLVSRNEEKLKTVAQELKHDSNVECKIVMIDFTKAGEEEYLHLKDVIKDLQIGILVNNAGTGGRPLFLPHVKKKHHEDIISCNAQAPVKVIEAVLPFMLKQKKGLVINISSVSAQINVGILAVYAATKRFLCNFTLALAREYEAANILFHCVVPGFVETNMTAELHNKMSKYIMCDPKTFVKYCLRAIGKREVACGYWTHELQQDFTNFIPESIIVFITQRSFKRIVKQELLKQRPMS